MSAETIGEALSLTAEIQRQFGFTPDATQQWLQSDAFGHVGIGGMMFGEDLPTRARLSVDGTAFEIGARIQDLEGLIELNRLTKPKVQSVETVINFWKDNPGVRTSVEDEWLFIGADIEPTIEGMEKDYQRPSFAYDTALESAISGRTYKQLARDRRWYGGPTGIIKIAEGIRDNGTSGIFERLPRPESEPSEGAYCPLPVIVTADHLKDYPLETSRTAIHSFPGRIKALGIEAQREDAFTVRANNGGPNVDISYHHTEYDNKKKGWDTEGVGLHLPIPEGIEIKTVADLVKLTRAEIRPWVTRGEAEITETDVNITVENDRIIVTNSEDTLHIEIDTLACTDCKIPNWKFPGPKGYEAGASFSAGRPEFTLGGETRSGGVHGYQVFMKEGGEKHLYCADCVAKKDAAYIEEHPLVLRRRSIQEARHRLDDAGYADVQIMRGQVWRTPGMGNRNFRVDERGWEFSTEINYRRDGKKIKRYTGAAVLTDDGEFIEKGLMPREYVDFRYKAD